LITRQRVYAMLCFKHMIECSDERVAQQHGIMDAFLAIAAFEGWNDTTLTKASVAAGEHPLAGKRLFPEGVPQLASTYHAHINALLATHAGREELNTMRVHMRIHWLVMERLSLLEPHKEAVRRLVAYGTMPWHMAWAARELWTLCDVMWRLAGDNSTDMNYYSKRSLLATVYKSTMLCWLQDESEGYSDTAAFAMRRIDDVLRVGKHMHNMQQEISTRVEQVADRVIHPRRYRTKKT
jgi:ubiquinone biosynthesis protein COQ9